MICDYTNFRLHIIQIYLLKLLINNRGEKDQSGKTGLELFGCLLWLAIADTLRTASIDFDNEKLKIIKEILV